MNATHAKDFATWLAEDQPELFVALYKKALPQTVRGIGSFTDVLSSIGTSLSNAASSVGTYLTSSQGLDTLSKLAGTYLTTQASKNAVNTNLARVQAGYAPAPIQTVYNPNTGEYQAVVTNSTGAVVPLSNSVQSALTSMGLPSWAPWALGGAGLLLLVLLLRK